MEPGPTSDDKRNKAGLFVLSLAQWLRQVDTALPSEQSPNGTQLKALLNFFVN